ncbi:MAG: D-alanyl-D-alanine carboxypeptidase, partial [Butyrivibrio sp.]|nr:D-alanyl-D-alanine carboxypeptidase [Butyrivibrio sp.]
NVRINPASMTKILTLLVAVEHLDNIDNTFTMTREIGDFVFKNDCSAVGFEVGEVLTIKDLLYGTILPSGADAAMCLAEYIAGSQEAFVDMMNEKLEELGLSDTAHFTNCVGVYDEDHYCTLMDMAMILKAAEENDLCHQVLNARTYLTTPTTEHPDGLQISNWFLRRIEDKDTHGEVVGAKTGFVNQSGCCGASYQISNEGKHYICVTADAWSSWRCIYDQVDIYDTYTS